MAIVPLIDSLWHELILTVHLTANGGHGVIHIQTMVGGKKRPSRGGAPSELSPLALQTSYASVGVLNVYKVMADMQRGPYQRQ
jgi:hypothetical protein